MSVCRGGGDGVDGDDVVGDTLWVHSWSRMLLRRDVKRSFTESLVDLLLLVLLSMFVTIVRC